MAMSKDMKMAATVALSLVILFCVYMLVVNSMGAGDFAERGFKGAVTPPDLYYVLGLIAAAVTLFVLRKKKKGHKGH